jgi:hypothetical protein
MRRILGGVADCSFTDAVPGAAKVFEGHKRKTNNGTRMFFIAGGES